jgi:protein involved in polysaccharide export with SLBB domain
VPAPNFTWSLPAGFPVFGTPTSDSIRVAVFGYAVNRPGYYYLSRGTTVHGAIDAAQGLKNNVWWKRPYSGIQRPRPDGSVQTIWFQHRADDEQMALENGDRLRISHEVY